MFIRFVVNTAIDGMQAREGFFSAAYELRETGQLDQHSSDYLEELLKWFRDNLSIPDRFNRSRSKAAAEKETKGLSWFRPTARAHIQKARELVTLLELHGFHVDTLKTDRPGFVTFEDEVQVVAEPFSDTPC